MVGPLRYMQQNVLTLVGLSPDRTSHETKMIKAILFDAFGTLAEIAERRRPYAKLLSLADTESRPTDADYAAIVMGQGSRSYTFIINHRRHPHQVPRSPAVQPETHRTSRPAAAWS